MSCCVPMCLSKKTKSTFYVPQDNNLLKMWEDNLGVNLKRNSRVCELHFKSNDIITQWVSGQGFSIYTVCLKKPRLKIGVLPKKGNLDCSALANSLVMSQTKKIKIINNTDIVGHDHYYFSKETNDLKLDSLFEQIFKYYKSMKVPIEWFVDIQSGYSKQLYVCFHKLGPFKKDYTRYIEKQLVLTRVKYKYKINFFGGEINIEGSNKANHALVLMWQSLEENVTQPIAVFASHGTVKAKLILKAIMLMEGSGGQVIGLTCDGASTSRTMWNQLGISAKSESFKNYFENPFDSTRKIFVFSDAPHLIKTMRNRIYEKKTLRIHPNNAIIKWEHYHNIFKTEEHSLLKVCPKLTKNHFELNNLSKMKVKYAAQLFSMSVANGMEFYKKKIYNCFNDAEDTIKFTIVVNNMFDALNRKFPAEGIRENSKDLEVLLCVGFELCF